jgi:hypothetical protein
VGTWCLNEIAFAIRKCGYKLLATYEVYAYKQRVKLFKSFLEPLARHKIQYSGFPSHVRADAEKQAFTNDINTTMRWEEGNPLFLRPEDIVYSASLVAQYKLMMNGEFLWWWWRLLVIRANVYPLSLAAFLGKFSQDNTQKTFSVAVHNQKELSELFWRTDCEVIDFVRMSPNVVECYLRPRSGMNKPSLKTSPVIGSYVTSLARIEMHAAIQVGD